MNVLHLNYRYSIIIIIFIIFFIELHPSEYLVPRQAKAIDCADIDQDNDIDIVVSCYYTNTIPDTIAILLNDGTGYFTVTYLQKETSHFLKCIKIDNDELPDLVTKIFEDYQFVYYHNNGDGSFGEATPIHSTLSNHQENISIADINDDGDNDIVFWKSGLDSYWGVMHNTGYGNFFENVYYNTAANTMHLNVGKINDDEYDDVLLTTTEGSFIFFSDLPGFIQSEPDLFQNTHIYSLDMENDGDNDIGLFSHNYFIGFPCEMKMLYNSGDGTVAYSDTLFLPCGTLINDINDFDNDGYPDLVYCFAIGFADESIYVALNDQNGDFNEPVSYNIGLPARFKTSAADFDNNGYDDLVITGYSLDNDHDGVRILFNDGSGNFVEEPQVICDELMIQNSKFKIQNYPNPFNPSTTIQFSTTTSLSSTAMWQAEGSENTELNIYNIKGQRIRSFKIQNSKFKINSVVWDGTDNYRNQVTSGVYLYRLVDDGKVLTSQKMILLK